MTQVQSTFDRQMTISLLEQISEMKNDEIVSDPEWIKKLASSAVGHIKMLQRQRNDLKRKGARRP